MRFVCFPVVAAVVFVVGTAATYAPAAFAQATATFGQAGLSVVFPASYNPAPSSQSSANTVFSRNGPTQGGVPSNINLSERPMPPTVKVFTKAMAEASAKVAKQAIPSYKMTASGTTNVGGESAAFVVAEITAQGHQMQAKQVLVVHKQNLYTFTLGGAAPLTAKQVADFDKMLASIKWR